MIAYIKFKQSIRFFVKEILFIIIKFVLKYLFCIDNFKIIEFNKENKRIVISHSRIWEEQRAEARVHEFESRKKEAKAATSAVKPLKFTSKDSVSISCKMAVCKVLIATVSLEAGVVTVR